ncbi:Cas10/Cmr2 second palm domain-containing protein [Aliarcobacter lanthieri]|uniref:Cas10/Cmr2 second palm domain-containing protein n=1 Tax=Aliarcobacter lanthieri TaxID=1355374 RepID=UPI003AAF6C73
MNKYLYGVSVQGIQEFIFKTNKLKEIIGASKIVEDMDKIDFQEKYKLEEKPEVLLQAAGNIRLVFENKQDLEKVVKTFSKDIMLSAYGITISQAVVELNDYQTDSKELEKKLKIQRNKVSLPLDFNLNIFKLNTRTALPFVNKDEDKATEQKVDKFQKFADEEKRKDRETIFDIEKLSNNKNKIAIIHADGNGLGNIVKDLRENEIKEFSQKLDEYTKKAYETASSGIKKIRKVILGGDDLAVICDANEALTFTKKFLEEFEKNTKKIHKDFDLTACAGIAFCNEKYPFHYAVKLAEELCSYAKKDSKSIDEKLPPSSLIFHNIQSSNVESFSKFIDDELTINKKEKIRCDFGPYYLKEQKNKPTIEIFEEVLKDFKKDNSPKGRLREWLSDLEFDRTYADNQLKRIKEVSKEKWKSENLSKLYEKLKIDNLIVNKDEKLKTPIYDILQILSATDESEKQR